MTLLEGVVALVVLSLSALGFLDVFRAGASTASRAASTSQVVAAAEAGIEAASLGDAAQAQEALPGLEGSMARQVAARPWGSAPGVTEVIVIVTPPGGAPFEVRRLVRDLRATGVRP
jgi:type II secretory pathway pseudopilin PulG